MGTIAKLKKDVFEVVELDERLPCVTDGLINYYPLDCKAGTMDIINGNTPVNNSVEGVNLLEATKQNWRDPLSWNNPSGKSYDPSLDAIKVEGYRNAWLKTPIVIDPSKTYQISVDVMETVDSSVGLYLGGYSLMANGVRATTNFDYTIAANDEPTHNVWKSYKLTRTGTAVASSRTASTTFSNVSGWNGGVGLIKYYHFGGLLNYNSGGVVYLRNLKIEIMDTDTSNITCKNGRTGVEEATTNWIQTGVYWYAPYATAVLKNYKLIYTIIHSTRYFVLRAGSPTQQIGKTLTVSGIMKKNGYPVTFTPNKLSTYESAGCSVFNGPNGYFEVTQYYNTSKTWIFHCPTPSCVVGDVFTIEDFQVEEKAFATSFTETTRARGLLTIPNRFDTTGGTFSLKATLKNTNAVYRSLMGNTWGTQAFFCFTSNTSPHIYFYYPKAVSHSPVVTSFVPVINKEHHYIFTWNTTTMYLWADGVLIGTSAADLSATRMSTEVGSINLASHPSYQSWGLIRDVSVYDRMLTDTEIKKLTDNKMSIREDKIIVPELIESKNLLNLEEWYRAANGDTTSPYWYTALNSNSTPILFSLEMENAYRHSGHMRMGEADGTGTIPISTGKYYRFSIYLRHASGYERSTSISIDFNDRGHTSFNLTYDWKLYSIDFLHDNNANYKFADITPTPSTAHFEWKDPCLEEIDINTLMRQKDGYVQVKFLKEYEDNDYRYEGSWQLVYDGLATESFFNYADNRVYELPTGQQIPFSELKIRAKFWNYEYIAPLTSMAYYNKSWYEHSHWLNIQGDASSPTMKFNATAGGNDADRTIGLAVYASEVMHGYGNSWRRILPAFYIGGVDSLYLGNAVSTYGGTLETDFGLDSGHYYFNSGNVRSNSGALRSLSPQGRPLTPLEFQSIQVFIR